MKRFYMTFLPPRQIAAFFLILVLFIIPGEALCEMVAMDDMALSQITGHGFSNFSLTHDAASGMDIARVDLNLQADAYATIDSMKMGYWDNGTGIGWDQNWNGVTMGSVAQDLALNGFFIETQFTDIDDATARQLKTIEIGFKQAYGTLSADFSSLSLKNSTRENAGAATYTFNGDPLVMRITVDSDNPGVAFDFGDAVRQ